MKPSSDLNTSKSFCWPAAFSDWSTVVPFFPVVWNAGFGWIAVEEDEEDLAERAVVMAFCEEFGDTFEGKDPADGLYNNPEISKRLRAFHIV